MNGMDFTLLFRILNAIGICIALFFTGWSFYLMKRDLKRVRDVIYNTIKLKPWLYRGVFIAWLIAKVQLYGLTAIFAFLIAFQILLNLKHESDMLPFFCFGTIAFALGHMASHNRNQIK
jgi:hypothetical protein